MATKTTSLRLLVDVTLPEGANGENLAQILAAAIRTHARDVTDDEALIGAGEGASVRAYFRNVRACAEGVIERMSEEPGQEFPDAMHEICDGDSYVIYTHLAHRALFASKNDEAADELGIDCENIHQRAYWALQADVIECLELMGIDPNWSEGEWSAFARVVSKGLAGMTEEEAEEHEEAARAGEAYRALLDQ
jgi:hypothetical protein